jgi:hypothetical protein
MPGRVARIVLLSLVSSALLLLGQVSTAHVSGVVLDSSGAAVAEANLTLTQVETSQIFKASSNQLGAYAFPNLPVGSYSIEVEKSGFASYKQTGIVLTVGQVASVPITLKVGDVSQSVEVSSDVQLVQTSDATISRLVDTRQVEGLPLNGRNPANLVFLAPGVSNPVQNVPGSNTGSPILQNSLVYPSSIAPTVNGVRGGGVYFALDGANNVDPYQVTGGPFPNPDAVAEFNVSTSTYGARYVSAPGGAVNVVTKSGTNQFHGALFEFLRNGDFNARNFFAAQHDQLKRNQFGFAAGAPIRRDKLFIFGSYQRMFLRDIVGGQVAFVPTAAERAGDFSAISTAIKDPNTNSPFPGNQIPVSRFDPTMVKLLPYIPMPPSGSLDGRTVFSRPVAQDENQLVVKADQYISASQRIFVRYLWSGFNWDGVAVPDNNILASFRGQTHRWDNGAFGHTWSRSNMVNEFRFSYVRDNSVTTAGESSVTLAGLGARLTNGQFPTIQSLTATGFFTIVPGNYNGWPRDNYDIADNVSIVKGRHEISFGTEIQRIVTTLITDNGQNITTTFGGSITGNALGDFFLGRPASLNQSDGIFIKARGVLWGFHAEDRMRVNSRLTVTAGVRWDPYLPFYAEDNRMQCFIPGQQSAIYVNAPTGLNYPGDPGCDSRGTASNLLTIQPRVGFAYQPNKIKTVLRGGYGLYTQQQQTAYFLGFGRVQPFVRSFALVSPPSISDPWNGFAGGNPFANGFKLDGDQRAKDSPFINPSVANTLAPHLHLPYVQQWSLTLEHALTTNDVVSLGYVGTKGTRLSLAADYNQAVYIPGQSTQTNTQARRPFPAISTIVGMRDDGNSSFNALQVTVRHRARGGLTLTSNFTWSKSIDITSAPANILLTGGGLIPNPFNPRLRRGRSDFDIPLSWRTTFVWAVPYAKQAKGLKRVVSDWEVNGLFTVESGFPFSIAATANNSFTGNGLDQADVVPGQSIAVSGDRTRGQQVNQWFNTAAFVTNQPGTFGNSGRNIVTAPGLVNFDLALVKPFNITERLKFQFRNEFFNLFNTPQFLPPGNSFGSATYGKITSARDPRILQLSLKATW